MRSRGRLQRRMLAAVRAGAGALALALALAVPPSLQAQGNRPAIEVRYYFSPECTSCIQFIEREIPRMERAAGVEIKLTVRDIRLPGVLEELDALLAGRGLTLTVLPVLAVGDVLLVGSREINGGFEEALRGQIQRGAQDRR